MSAHQPDEVVRMKLPCRDSAHFLSEFAPKMSSRIFVPMETPPAAGTAITLHIKFQDGEVHVKGRAEIIKAVASPRSGVHVRFTALDPDSVQFPLTKTTTGQSAILARPSADEHTTTGETYIPPEAATSSPSALTSPAVPSPAKPSSPAFVPYVPKPAPSAPAPFVPFVPKPSSPSAVRAPDAAPAPKPSSPSSLLDPPPPKPSSPKPASSLLSDPPPPRPSSPSSLLDPPPPKPSSPKPASSLLSDPPPPRPSSPSSLLDPPPPKPSSPKPASSPLSDPPPPAAPDPFGFLSAASTSKEPAHAAESKAAVTHVTAAPEPAPPFVPASSPSRLPAVVPAPAPPPRDSRPLDAPPRVQKPKRKPVEVEQEDDDDVLPPPSKSRAPLMVGLALVAVVLVGGGLFVAFGNPLGPAKPTPVGAAPNRAVVDLLRKMDEQMMAGRYAGPGGDTALDSLQVALATAPDNARVKEYQEKLATFFERRAAEAAAKSDHAEAAVQLIALSLADPKRAGVKERLLAEEDQVKNQARR
ncbi:MAG: hypothetical protein Q8L48_03380 [Archangium sp.]|nr:hypothetical protein [Archangium sp.]